MVMLAMSVLPVPLISIAGRAGEPLFEGMGPGGLLFFLPGRNSPKVGGRCTLFWWIGWVVDAKSLIVEQKFLTKWGETSTKSVFSSTKSVFSSTTAFFGFTPLFSLFSLCKQEEEEEERHPPKGAFNPPILSGAYFLIHQLHFAFRAFGGLWWMKNRLSSMACVAIHQYPPIHLCFPPPPPEEVFS